MRTRRHYLRIYLSDHYAASVVARRLLERLIAENQSDPIAEPLRRLRIQVEEDAETCRRVLQTLRAWPSPFKNVLAMAGETLGRLKLNGHVLSYSPLSRLVEMEGLSIGIAGKRKLWETLELLAERDGRLREFDFKRLQARADEQLHTVSELHQRAAERVLRAPQRGETTGRAA